MAMKEKRTYFKCKDCRRIGYSTTKHSSCKCFYCGKFMTKMPDDYKKTLCPVCETDIVVVDDRFDCDKCGSGGSYKDNI